jgi:hypothetical protein
MSATNITFHHVFLQLVSTATGFLLILSGAMRTILTWLGKVVVVTRGCTFVARKVYSGHMHSYVEKVSSSTCV